MTAAARSASELKNTILENPVTKEYIQSALRKYEKDETITVEKLTTTRALQYGDNFIADVFRVKIDGDKTKDGGMVVIDQTVIVKIPNSDKINTPREMFKNESFIYNNVLGPLEKAFGAKLPVIRCIKAEETVVVTEDFRDGNWGLTDRHEGMTHVQCQKIINSLAKFHAASIILAHTNEALYEDLIEKLEDQVFTPLNESICRRTLADNYVYAKNYANSYTYTGKSTPAEAEAIKKFFKLCSDEMYDMARRATNDTADADKVIVHGECWANNIMLKMDNSEDHALLVNLETVCLASPARDLVYLFTTNPQTLDHASLMNHYIDELHSHLIAKHMSNSVIEKYSLKFIAAEVERLKPLAYLTTIWLITSMSYYSHPSFDEYNRLTAAEKVLFVAKHINEKFYVRRMVDVFLSYM